MNGRFRNLGIVIALMGLIAGLGLMWAVRTQTEPALKLALQPRAIPA